MDTGSEDLKTTAKHFFSDREWFFLCEYKVQDGVQEAFVLRLAEFRKTKLLAGHHLHQFLP